MNEPKETLTDGRAKQDSAPRVIKAEKESVDGVHAHIFSSSSSSQPRKGSWASLLNWLDVSPDALVIVNQTGQIMLVNDQAETLFGYRRSELVGQPLEMLLPQRFYAVHILHRERYATSPRTRPMGAGLELYGLRKDGTEVPVDISLSPLLVDGELSVLGAIRDITERRRASTWHEQRLKHSWNFCN
jgi:PAS domain S-box-containing protein